MSRFYFYHVVLPFCLLLFASLMLDYYRVDLMLADKIYALEGYSWSLRDSWLLEDLLHRGGRKFSGFLLILTMLALIATWFIPAMNRYRKELWYLIGVVAVALIIVGVLKEYTNIECPWSLKRFGGTDPDFMIFANIFGSGLGRCFPAGHASAGYVWVALYFVFIRYNAQWKYAGLGFGLLLGAMFGVAQQIRGAHFISHDIWTLAICWFTSLAGYIIFFKKSKKIPNVSQMI